MAATTTRDHVRGKTLRFSFTEGPTQGTTYEHEFGDDGMVTYRDAAATSARTSDGERARYGSFAVAPDIQLVSYLSTSGFTLTLAVNFRSGEIVGFASNDKQWFPVKGHLATG
jgi:hypothetical protein